MRLGNFTTFPKKELSQIWKHILKAVTSETSIVIQVFSGEERTAMGVEVVCTNLNSVEVLLRWVIRVYPRLTCAQDKLPVTREI